MVLLEAAQGKPPNTSWDSNMPSDDQDRHHPYPNPSDSTGVASPAAPKPDRATYESSRRAELDRIRLIDIKRRQLLAYFCPLGIHEIDHLWDDEDISLPENEEYSKVQSEWYLSHRVLIHAVEGYLLGCVEYSVLTAETALTGRKTPFFFKVVLVPFTPLRQGMLPETEPRLRVPQHRGVGPGCRQIVDEAVSEGVTELSQGNDAFRTMTIWAHHDYEAGRSVQGCDH
jgi:hypothetical protein